MLSWDDYNEKADAPVVADARAVEQLTAEQPDFAGSYFQGAVYRER